MRSLSIKLFSALLGLSLLLALTGIQPVYAASIVVNSTADNITPDGQCTLREAIGSANNDSTTNADCATGSGDDTITFNLSACPCTITLSLGELYIYTNMTITGNSASDLTISGGNASRVFSINTATLNLSGLTITGGSLPAGSGGGIFIGNSSSAVLNISNSVISGNSAQSGGGIYSNSGTVTLLNSTVSNNTASGDGGGIYGNNSPTITITNSTITGNSATGLGIAIVNGGTVTVRNSTIADNTAGGGSNAIYNVGTMTLWNTIVSNSNCNAAVTNGGNNIDSGTTCGFGSANNSQSSTDPSLGTLTGSPAYFPIGSDSPAFDTGDDTVCTAAPVSNTSQNGATRPQGFHCDIGAFEFPMSTLIIKSVGTNDGWILESSETSSVGGTMNSTATTFNLGDDLANKQYRAILHFDTSSVPPTAIITSATLKIKKYKQTGSNPFTILGGLKVDMRKPSFGTTALALTDFKSAAGKTSAATFGATALSNWYSALLSNAGNLYINRTGITQFRLRFTTDDNNDLGDDYMRFYSGNAGAANQPQLVIQYYVP